MVLHLEVALARAHEVVEVVGDKVTLLEEEVSGTIHQEVHKCMYVLYKWCNGNRRTICRFIHVKSKEPSMQRTLSPLMKGMVDKLVWLM